ncbi:MFS transporter [Demetria terragena]|uniref:MFS transporter n=1 Tax=Demetria terragena TaxID=63959 RepID=UPI00037D0D12|nr:MFS transporter [Demetria terragena]
MAVPETFDFRRLAIPAYAPSLFFGLGEGAILPVMPLVARDLGASLSVAAGLVTLIQVGSLLFNVPAAFLSSRFGERKAIVGAALCGVLAAVISAFAPGLVVFAVGALLLGAAQSVFFLARQTYLTDAVPIAFRARALSTLGGIMRIGFFGGPFIGAAAIHFVDLRGAYAVCVVALVVAGLCAMAMPDLVSEARAGHHESVSAWTILRDHRRVFLTVGMGIVLVAVVRSARQVVIPLWADEIGMTAAAASLAYGVSNAVDMLVFYPAGKVMDVWGRRWVTVPSMTLMGLALLAIPLTSAPLAFTAVACVLGFANGIGSGMVMTLGADLSPARGRIQFLGIWRVLSDLGAVGGPATVAMLTAVWTLGVGVAACGGVGLAAALVLWRAAPRSTQS